MANENVVEIPETMRAAVLRDPQVGLQVETIKTPVRASARCWLRSAVAVCATLTCTLSVAPLLSRYPQCSATK